MQEQKNMLIGYHFPHYMAANKSPLDFMADPETGLRPDEKTKPSGVSIVDMTAGIRTWQVIPSLAVWERGKWFLELDHKFQESLHSVDDADQWETWVVSGEGTPGNFVLRCYTLPQVVAKAQEPRHPDDWTKHQKEKGDNKPKMTVGGGGTVGPLTKPDGNGTYGLAGGFGYGYSPTPVTPKKPDPPKLPVGIRFRCRGCGHWFKEFDLAGHSTHCCPGSSGPEGSDWAIMCECCEELDMVSQCKPGFPLDKKKEAEPTKAAEPEKEVVPA